jgi:hypothetical protein
MHIRWPLAASLTASLLLAQGSALAEDPPLADAPPPPIIEEDELQPRVTIVPGDDQTITEYRLNGELYMVKIEPVVGPAYYLVDTDGDGQLETRHDGPGDNLAIPRWLLLKW